MKLRHLLTGTILTVSLLAATAVTAFAAAPKGRFETVNSTTISGWAYNSSTPDDALNVRISIKDKNTGEEVFSQRITAMSFTAAEKAMAVMPLPSAWTGAPCPMAYIW